MCQFEDHVDTYLDVAKRLYKVGWCNQGLTLVPISAQLELTLPLSAQLKLTFPPI